MSIASTRPMERFADKYGSIIDLTQAPPHSVLSMSLAEGVTALGAVPSGHRVKDADDHPATVYLSDRAIEFGIIDGLTVNAVAGLNDNVGCAVVFAGLPVAIAEISAALWSNRLFMPWIGDISSLSDGDEHRNYTPLGFELLELLPESVVDLDNYVRSVSLVDILGSYAQLCGQRASALHSMLRAALSFVWLHELGHIVLGHVGQPRGPTSEDQSLEELSLASSYASEAAGISLDKHVLELMADRYACYHLYRWQVGSTDQFSPSEDRLLLALMAQNVVFLALHAQAVFCRKFSNANHPPLWFRSENLLRELSGWPNPARAPFKGMVGLIQRYHLSLRSLIRIHPLFGDWFGPTFNQERSIQYKALRSVLVRHAKKSKKINTLVPWY